MSDLAEPFNIPIERGKIREFARAIQTKDPAYTEDPQPVIPPTFLTTRLFWQTGPSRPKMPTSSRVLHGEEEYVFYGTPPRAGAELTAVSRTEPAVVKEGKRGGTMTFTDIITEYRDRSGTLVAESRMTLIETARPPKAEES